MLGYGPGGVTHPPGVSGACRSHLGAVRDGPAVDRQFQPDLLGARRNGQISGPPTHRTGFHLAFPRLVAGRSNGTPIWETDESVVDDAVPG